MRKIIALLCFVAVIATATPIFAEDSAVTLTPAQLEKLDATQTNLNSLVTKIDDLLTFYKGKKKAKGLLVALKQYRKQAVKLNNSINKLRDNPPKFENGTLNVYKANKLIKLFNKKEIVLEKKVAKKAKLLNKIKKFKKVKKNKKNKK